MDERTIFDRFHDALDVEPRGGAYDRLRFELTSSPIVLKRRPGSGTRFTRMGFRIVAAAVAALIVVLAVVGYLSLHHPAVGMVPANPGPDVRPYQALIARDYATTYSSESAHCDSITDAGCPAAIDKVSTNLAAWQQDLKEFKTPPRFIQIDAMLRGHLAAAVAAGNAAKAAQKAGNVALFDAAAAEHLSVRAFIVELAAAIADTRVLPAASYTSGVTDQKDLLASCTPCAPYLVTPPITCTKGQLAACVGDAVAVDAQIYDFETAIVQGAAPAALAAKDGTLQKDLVNADSALLAMVRAGLAGDPAAFNSAAASAQASISAVSADAASIRTG